MVPRMLLTIPDREALGLLVFSDTINEWVADHSEVLAAISRMVDLFTSGDWGDLDEDDWQCNIDTIQADEPGGRLMGAYKLPDGRRIWIITDGYGNQSLGPLYCYTTVLAPEDY
jgi:hypothetical protein